MTDSSSQSFFRRHWEGYKEFWSERFSFLDNYSRFVKRDNPLPSWSDADVQEFIASDPVHGPTLRTAREAAKYGSAGAVIGAVSTAAVAWKYSRSLHDATLITGDEETTFVTQSNTQIGMFDPIRCSKGGTVTMASMVRKTLFQLPIVQSAALSFGAGAVFGWTFGQEVANHALQLYRLDTMSAQVKFLDWWEKKCAERA